MPEVRFIVWCFAFENGLTPKMILQMSDENDSLKDEISQRRMRLYFFVHAPHIESKNGTSISWLHSAPVVDKWPWSL